MIQKIASEEKTDAAHALEYYRIIREMIEHEDSLIGNRMNLFVTSQSFLFTAYAVISNGIQSGTPVVSGNPRRTLLTIIPMVAIATAILISLAIVSGYRAMRALRKHYAVFSDSLASTPLPPIQGVRNHRLMGMVAPTLLPVLFMSVWIYLLVKHLF
ncbi:MAG TPA: hypothetical protein VHS31_00090 [Tepidisphaeraceae bacterium]|nr:hypothetical protein [Tepidisphaeraceae bacterium]